MFDLKVILVEGKALQLKKDAAHAQPDCSRALLELETLHTTLTGTGSEMVAMDRLHFLISFCFVAIESQLVGDKNLAYLVLMDLT